MEILITVRSSGDEAAVLDPPIREPLAADPPVEVHFRGASGAFIAMEW